MNGYPLLLDESPTQLCLFSQWQWWPFFEEWHWQWILKQNMCRNLKVQSVHSDALIDYCHCLPALWCIECYVVYVSCTIVHDTLHSTRCTVMCLHDFDRRGETQIWRYKQTAQLHITQQAVKIERLFYNPYILRNMENTQFMQNMALIKKKLSKIFQKIEPSWVVAAILFVLPTSSRITWSLYQPRVNLYIRCT
jgi:hypothetical protein